MPWSDACEPPPGLSRDTYAQIAANDRYLDGVCPACPIFLFYCLHSRSFIARFHRICPLAWHHTSRYQTAEFRGWDAPLRMRPLFTLLTLAWQRCMSILSRGNISRFAQVEGSVGPGGIRVIGHILVLVEDFVISHLFFWPVV